MSAGMKDSSSMTFSRLTAGRAVHVQCGEPPLSGDAITAPAGEEAGEHWRAARRRGGGVWGGSASSIGAGLGWRRLGRSPC